MASTASKQLADDHGAVHEVLTQLLAALKNKDVKTSYVKLDLLWARLAVHIRAEHLHLFPAVVSRMNAAQSTVEALRVDHDFFMRELARAVGILRELSLASAENDLTYVLGTVLEVEKRLADHNNSEEHQIYHWARTLLTPTEQTNLAARINAELDNRPPRFSLEVWTNK